MIRPLTWRQLAELLESSVDPWKATLAGQAPPVAWSVQLLAAVGTWLATILLLLAASLGLAGLADALYWTSVSVLLVPSGVMLVAVGVALRRVRRWPLLVEPLAFAAAFIGSCFLAGYLALEWSGETAPAGAVLAACGVILATALRDVLGRSCGVAMVAVGTGVAASHFLSESAAYAVSAAIGGMACGLGMVAPRSARWAALGVPLTWGGLAVTYGVIGIQTSTSDTGASVSSWLASGGPRLTAAVVAASVVGTGLRLARTRPTRAAAVLVPVGLAAIGAHGVAAGLLGVILAIQRGSRPLLAFTLLFLAAFCSWYYYSLELSLWAKATVLAGSGAFLLLSRAVLLRHGRSAA